MSAEFVAGGGNLDPTCQSSLKPKPEVSGMDSPNRVWVKTGCNTWPF